MPDYKIGNCAKLRKLFSDIDWKEEMVRMDVNCQYSIFCEHYKAGLSKFIPPPQKKKKKAITFTMNVKKLKRDLLFNRYIRHRSKQPYRRKEA